MSNERAIELSALLEHRSFVLRIAQRLLRDPHDAEDVAQQTWVSSARENVAHVDEPRGWLARIARNHAFNLMRDRARRERRDAAAAAAELVEDDASVSERVETAERVVRAVMTLDEPIRSTVLMRFYDDLPTRAIADRQRVSMDAVQWRLARGLERLRLALDDGDSRGEAPWRARLGVLVAASAATTTAAHAFAVPLVFAVLLAAAVGIVFAVREPTRAPGSSNALVVDSDRPADATAPALVDDAARTNTPIANADLAPVANPATFIRGRVIDLHRAPVAGATVSRVSLTTGEALPLGTTDDAGSFAVDAGDAIVGIRVEHDGFFPATRSDVVPGAALDIVLEPGAVIEGRVEDASTHAAVAGAQVYVEGGMHVTPQFASTMTVADGRFAIVVPLSPSTLTVEREDFAQWRSEAFEPTHEALAVRLVHGAPPLEPTVYVRVRDAATGVGVDGMEFDFGPSQARGDGLYFVAASPMFPGSSTIQFRADEYEARWEEIEDGRHATPDTAFEVALVRAAVCRGRIVDEAGAPIAGSNVTLSWSDADVPVAERRFPKFVTWSVKTDEGGLFVCDHLPLKKPIDVTATAPTRAPATVTWTDGDPEPTVRLERAPTFRLCIVDAQTGLAVDASLFRAYAATSTTAWSAVEWKRVAIGELELARGNQSVTCLVRADDYAQNETVIDPARADATIELTRGLEMTVLVRDSDGNTIANAAVRSSDVAGNDGPTSATDADGIATIRGLVPGRWSFVARRGERQSRSQGFDVVGSGARVELTLPPLTGVRCRIRVDRGLEPATFQVAWFRDSQPDGRNIDAKETSGGAFFVGMHPAVGEPCTVRLDIPGFEPCQFTKVVLSEGEVRDLEFVLVRKP